MTQDDRPQMILTEEMRAVAVAELTVHAINHLDGEAEDPDGGCCPDCCAPCHALFLLWAAGELAATIAPFIAEEGGWVWLRPDGGVDEAWLRNGWRLIDSHPDHDS